MNNGFFDFIFADTGRNTFGRGGYIHLDKYTQEKLGLLEPILPFNEIDLSGTANTTIGLIDILHVYGMMLTNKEDDKPALMQYANDYLVKHTRVDTRRFTGEKPLYITEQEKFHDKGFVSVYDPKGGIVPNTFFVKKEVLCS